MLIASCRKYEFNYFILCITKKLRKTTSINRKTEDHVGSATTQGGRGKSPLNVLYYLARTHGRNQDGRIASRERGFFYRVARSVQMLLDLTARIN
jgi:hypothetical protein